MLLAAIILRSLNYILFWKFEERLKFDEVYEVELTVCFIEVYFGSFTLYFFKKFMELHKGNLFLIFGI
jgi:hypothetical protein